MELSLPKSLYQDYTDATRFAGAQWFTEADRARIDQFIKLLNYPQTRAAAILHLVKEYQTNKEKGPSLGLLLWNSTGTIYSLLQELSEGHRLLYPPRISLEESTRICNALILIQCIATHPEARMGLIQAEIPQYFYPFLKTSVKELLQFDHLRLTGLIVIRELVKEVDHNSTMMVNYLLKIETVPLCLQCMDFGGDVSKSVAAFVLGKILKQQEGKIYLGSFIDRFFVVLKALSKMVNEFTEKPPTPLLKNILKCYSRLAEISWWRDVLKGCYPLKLKDLAYLDRVCDEPTKLLAHLVLSKWI